MVVRASTTSTFLSSGIRIPSGQGYGGKATLVAGSVTVPTTRVTSNSIVHITANGGVVTNIGNYSVIINPGVSFSVTSSNAADTSLVGWSIVEPV